MTPLELVEASAPETETPDAGGGPDAHSGSTESEKAGTPADLYVAELERELRTQRRRIAKLLKVVEGREDKRRETYLDTALRIDAYWRERCHPDARPLKPHGARERAVIGRLADGYSEAYICRAVDGAKAAPHRSERGDAFDDLELICRTEVKLESFHRRAPKQEDPEVWLGPRIDPYQ